MTLHTAYIIHTRPYLETSLIVEAFTLEEGRMGLLAKGARRSKKGAHLSPFQPYYLQWRGRGELPTLTHWEAQAEPHSLSGRGLISGLYLNELVYRATYAKMACETLYRAYEKALYALSSDDHSLAWTLRKFEHTLLKTLGVGLNCTHDADDNPIDPNKQYRYVMEKGFVENHSGFSGSALGALAEEMVPSSRDLAALKHLLTQCIEHTVGLIHSRALGTMLWQS